jgi:hypothetical protein
LGSFFLGSFLGFGVDLGFGGIWVFGFFEAVIGLPGAFFLVNREPKLSD